MKSLFKFLLVLLVLLILVNKNPLAVAGLLTVPLPFFGLQTVLPSSPFNSRQPRITFPRRVQQPVRRR